MEDWVLARLAASCVSVADISSADGPHAVNTMGSIIAKI